LVHSVRN